MKKDQNNLIRVLLPLPNDHVSVFVPKNILIIHTVLRYCVNITPTLGPKPSRPSIPGLEQQLPCITLLCLSLGFTDHESVSPP